MNKKRSRNTKTGMTRKLRVLRRRSGKAVQVTNIFCRNETPTSYPTLLCLELLNLNRNECFLFLNHSMFHLVPFLSILDPIICLQINTLSLSFPFFLLPILSFVFLRLILSKSCGVSILTLPCSIWRDQVSFECSICLSSERERDREREEERERAKEREREK